MGIQLLNMFLDTLKLQQFVNKETSMKLSLLFVLGVVSLQSFDSSASVPRKNFFMTGSSPFIMDADPGSMDRRLNQVFLGTGQYSRELEETMKRPRKLLENREVKLDSEGESKISASAAESKSTVYAIKEGEYQFIEYSGTIKSYVKIECQGGEPIVTESSSFSAPTFIATTGETITITGANNQVFSASNGRDKYYFNELIETSDGDKIKVTRNALRFVNSEKNLIAGHATVEATCK